MTQKASTPVWKGKTGIFVGGILLVAAVIAFVSLDGYPPSDDESAGAIGAAKRYRVEQISDADVVLENAEIQELLQNDAFQKLIADPEFRKMAARSDFGDLMASQAMAQAMENRPFRAILAKRMHRQIQPETIDLLADRASAIKLDRAIQEDPVAMKAYRDKLEEPAATAAIDGLRNTIAKRAGRDREEWNALSDAIAKRMGPELLKPEMQSLVADRAARSQLEAYIAADVIAKQRAGDPVEWNRIQDFIAKRNIKLDVIDDGTAQNLLVRFAAMDKLGIAVMQDAVANLGAQSKLEVYEAADVVAKRGAKDPAEWDRLQDHIAKLGARDQEEWNALADVVSKRAGRMLIRPEGQLLLADRAAMSQLEAYVAEDVIAKSKADDPAEWDRIRDFVAKRGLDPKIVDDQTAQGFLANARAMDKLGMLAREDAIVFRMDQDKLDGAVIKHAVDGFQGTIAELGARDQEEWNALSDAVAKRMGPELLKPEMQSLVADRAARSQLEAYIAADVIAKQRAGDPVEWNRIQDFIAKRNIKLDVIDDGTAQNLLVRFAAMDKLGTAVMQDAVAKRGAPSKLEIYEAADVVAKRGAKDPAEWDRLQDHIAKLGARDKEEWNALADAIAKKGVVLDALDRDVAEVFAQRAATDKLDGVFDQDAVVFRAVYNDMLDGAAFENVAVQRAFFKMMDYPAFRASVTQDAFLEMVAERDGRLQKVGGMD